MGPSQRRCGLPTLRHRSPLTGTSSEQPSGSRRSTAFRRWPTSALVRIRDSRRTPRELKSAPKADLQRLVHLRAAVSRAEQCAYSITSSASAANHKRLLSAIGELGKFLQLIYAEQLLERTCEEADRLNPKTLKFEKSWSEGRTGSTLPPVISRATPKNERSRVEGLP